MGNLDLKSGVHVPNRAILECQTGSKAKSNPFLGRWNAGGRGSGSNPKNWIGHVIWNALSRCSKTLLELNQVCAGRLQCVAKVRGRFVEVVTQGALTRWRCSSSELLPPVPSPGEN
jgi:hypothetical protein